MTESQLVELCARWSGTVDPPSGLLRHPIGDFDIFEDDSRLINRLYFVVPSFAGNHFRCLIFFQENTFRKDRRGDLALIHTEYHVEKPDLQYAQQLLIHLSRYQRDFWNL